MNHLFTIRFFNAMSSIFCLSLSLRHMYYNFQPIYMCFKRYSHFQLCESDQHPGVALILTVFSQWHVGEHLGVEVKEFGEVFTVHVRVPFLFQICQIRQTLIR